MVQCAWCYGKLQGWEQGDNPLQEHARHFVSCPKFGNRRTVNAISLVHNITNELSFGFTFNLDNCRSIIESKYRGIIESKYRGIILSKPSSIIV